MAKVIVCPGCGARGPVSDGRLFEVRGIVQSRPVRRCTACGTGMFIKAFGRPKAIDAALWDMMQASWSKAFPPEAASVPKMNPSETVETANDPGSSRVVDRLTRTSSTTTMQDLVALFEEAPSRVQAADFDRAVASAIDVMARHFAVDKNPGLEPERFRREMGGFIVTGYLVGRRLLGSHESVLAYSRARDVAENAANLVSWSLLLDLAAMRSAFAPAFSTFVDGYAASQSEYGELGTLFDNEQAQRLLVDALRDGVSLAFGEFELFT